jgi:two-component system, cell cycle response regulator DivK
MKKIAVVEDNPDNRLLAHILLQDFYEVAEYANGTDALQGIKADKPDVVLLDISLPDLPGTEVLQHIRADAALKHLPVIALTAHAMAGDREKYLAAGFDDYVTKPIVNEKILLHAIEGVLGKASPGSGS